jgi:hypothetical protein
VELRWKFQSVKTTYNDPLTYPPPYPPPRPPAGSNSGGGEISAPFQICPRAQPAFCTMGTGYFLGVKRPGHGVDHPPPSSAEVKEE